MSLESISRPVDRLISLLDLKKPLKDILELVDSDTFQIDELSSKTKLTALGAAAYIGRFDVVKALIERGAKIDKSSGCSIVKAALLGKRLDILTYLLKINKTEKYKNVDLLTELISYLPNEDDEDKDFLKKIRATRNPIEKEQLAIRSLLAKGGYIDLSQFQLINKFKIFLTILKEKDPSLYQKFEDFFESFSRGFCHGEVLYWLYKSEHGMNKEVWDMFYKILLWNEEKDGLNIPDENGERLFDIFTQIIPNLLGLFNPGEYYKMNLNQDDADKIIALHSGKHVITFDSSFPILMTQEEMLYFLPELIQNDLMTSISNLKHTIGYRNKILLDPNNRDGLQAQETPEEVAHAIVAAFKTKAGDYIPLKIFRYAKDGRKPTYATPEEATKAKREFLNRLYAYREERGATKDQINYRSFNGVTLLYVACSTGDIDTVKWCIEKGADLELGKDGISPLTVAAGRGCANIVKTLLDNGALLLPKNRVISPFFYAVSHNQIDVVKIIIDHLQKTQVDDSTLSEELFLDPITFLTPLHICIKGEHLDMFDLLIEKGVDINVGIIHPLKMAVGLNNPDMVRKILQYKNKIKKGTLEEVLKIAVKSNYHTIIEELIKAGTTVNLETLNFAITEKATPKTLAILIDHQAALPLKEIASNWKQAKPILPHKLLPLYFKKLFNNAVNSSANYKTFKSFSEEGQGFPSFPDMIPSKQAADYLQEAIEEYSFEQNEYQMIEFILNNSKFDLNTTINGKKGPILPLEQVLLNASGEYDEEPHVALKKMKEITILFLAKGLHPDAGINIKEFAKANNVQQELVDCIKQTIEEESAKRKAVVKSEPILSNLLEQSPPLTAARPPSPPLPTAARPPKPPSRKKSKIKEERPSLSIDAPSKLLTRKSPPLPTTPRPVFRAKRAKIQADNDRKVELADEKQSAHLWEALKDSVNELASQSIDLNLPSISMVRKIQETIQDLEKSNPDDASKTNLLSQLAEKVSSFNARKTPEGVNEKVLSLLEKIRISRPAVMSSAGGKPSP